MGYAIPVKPGAKVDLANIEPKQDGGLTKEAGQKRLQSLVAELADLQELLYAAGDHALLVILQGMDTSGKDGTVREVFADVSPIGCQVVGFKVPTAEELGHDFLWRIHQMTPVRGMITVFNRSQYEDVLVVRVRGLASEAVWRPRYEQINAFEALLASTDMIVVKCFLHISKEEQEERLRAREADVTKAWKLSIGDWEERAFWNDYQAAYAEALSRCSTKPVPWLIIPADRKWFRNLAVAEALVETLRPYRDGWLKILGERGAEELAKIKGLRGRGNGATSA
ncbi:MAG: polyphosphate kinase 2 family protein [Propionibacteriaceae bacterium]|nr:polyphosphate kinase 2 family protein [Propionibacteriaceae bacterium]